MLKGYFPKQAQGFERERENHRLRREIVATLLANDMIDRGGPTFPYRLCGSAGVGPDTAALCFEGVRQLYGFEALTLAANRLDNQIKTQNQYRAHMEIMSVLRRQCYWLARRSGLLDKGVGAFLERYQGGVDILRQNASKVISEYEVENAAERIARMEAMEIPASLAKKIGELRGLISATDIIDLSEREDWPLLSVACLYHGFGDVFWFDKLRGAASSMTASDHWDRLAVRRLIEDFYRAQQRLSHAAISHISLRIKDLGAGREKPNRAWAKKVIASFCEVNETAVRHTQSALEELDRGEWTLAKLAIANTQMRELSVIAVS
jgi:glutamate dehydrogenase